MGVAVDDYAIAVDARCCVHVDDCADDCAGVVILDDQAAAKIWRVPSLHWLAGHARARAAFLHRALVMRDALSVAI
ncbi:MAG: hypothetical protein JSS23_00210 [Proteobacteria bacterium]|nr:hypothetical protein [Pseudomonadota bacterium]